MVINYAKQTAIIVIAPPLSTILQVFELQLVIDQCGDTIPPDYPSFNVIIDNKPPTFSSNQLSVTLEAGQTKSITVPIAVDPQNFQIYYSQNSSDASFAIFTPSTRLISIHPTTALGNGTYTVVIQAINGVWYAVVPFTLNIIVVNYPPSFTTLPIPDQSVNVQTNNAYSPPASDPENAIVIYTLYGTSNPTWVTIVSNSISMSPPGTLTSGSYTITLCISDGINIVGPESFTLNIVSQPLYFTSPLATQTVPVGSTIISQITDYIDPYNNPVTVSVPSLNPTFTSLQLVSSVYQITISPPYSIGPSTNTVEVYISDGTTIVGPESFTVIVINDPPYFTLPMGTQQVSVGATLQYSISNYIDPEGNSVSTALSDTSIPFNSLSSNILTISPPYSLCPSSFTQGVNLFDGFNTAGPFPIIINILNTAPNLVTPLLDQQVSVPDLVQYVLPNGIDPEGNTEVFSLLSDPTYVTIQQNTVSFQTNYSMVAQNVTITVNLFDGCINIQDTFNLEIINLPPLFDPPLQPLFLYGGCTSSKFTIPTLSDPEGNTVTFVIIGIIPKYASYDQIKTITFSPTVNDTNTETVIAIKLFDGSMYSLQYIPIAVIAAPPLPTSVSKQVSSLTNPAPPSIGIQTSFKYIQARHSHTLFLFQMQSSQLTQCPQYHSAHFKMEHLHLSLRSQIWELIKSVLKFQCQSQRPDAPTKLK